MTISQLEAAIDRTYRDTALPHSNRILATWYYLTASEDFQRCLFMPSGAEADASLIIFYLDKCKYSMKYALDRIAQETTRDPSVPTLPRRIIGKAYEPAMKLAMAGVDYSLASQVCGLVHSGTAVVAEHVDKWTIQVDESYHDKAYSVLELFGVGKPREFDWSALIFDWIRSPSNTPPIIQQIAMTVIFRNGLISYEYQQELAIKLALQVPQPTSIIPAAWTFCWGGQDETTLLLNALCLRCLYHLVAVHFGAGVYGIPGMGDSNIVLLISRDRLSIDIELMSSVGKDKIRAFLDVLTWGHKTESPDPALQPLIPINPDRYAIPCLHFLSSNHGRNLLSLMARTQSRDFDSQSWLFEVGMLESLQESGLPNGVVLRSNIHPRSNGTAEEIDLLLIDETNRQMLVCELKWMLGPGDSREIQNRKNACRDKVVQLNRKVEWTSNHTEVVAALALQSRQGARTKGPWLVSGIVLIEGFGGARSPDARYPVMPVSLFKLGLTKASSLSSLALWCEGLSWLPREEQHFGVKPIELQLDHSKPLILEGMDQSDSVSDFYSHLTDDLS